MISGEMLFPPDDLTDSWKGLGSVLCCATSLGPDGRVIEQLTKKSNSSLELPFSRYEVTVVKHGRRRLDLSRRETYQSTKRLVIPNANCGLHAACNSMSSSLSIAFR